MSNEQRAAWKAEMEKRNGIKTTHLVIFEGRQFEIRGYHELRYLHNSKFTYQVWTKQDENNSHGLTITPGKKLGQIFRELITRVEKSEANGKKYRAFENAYTALDNAGKISDSRFAYARFVIGYNLGDYYNLYWRFDDSPTGVLCVGACSAVEWEEISQLVGQSHNYLEPR